MASRDRKVVRGGYTTAIWPATMISSTGKEPPLLTTPQQLIRPQQASRAAPACSHTSQRALYSATAIGSPGSRQRRTYNTRNASAAAAPARVPRVQGKRPCAQSSAGPETTAAQVT